MGTVKICGITNPEDAFAAVRYGADAIGFVFYHKSPRAVSPETAKAIISSLPPFITTVGVFVDEEIREMERIASYAGLDVIQLHGSEPPDKCNAVRKVIKAVRVKHPADIEILRQYRDISAFLLDTFSPSASGGTGETFNWEIAVEAKRFGRIILAGGLNPGNVEEAIKLVRPYGVDVSSGVEGVVKGRKDHAKLKLFIERAGKAFRAYG